MSETATKARAPAPGPQLGRHAVQPAGPGGDCSGMHVGSALALQRSAGNRAVAGLVRSTLATQALQRCSCSSGGGKCAKCRQDDEVLRRSAVPGAAAPAPTSTAMVQSVLRTPGHSLDSSVRQDMESHFGVSLGGVRVHTDSAAAQSAEAVEAHAYTVGQHIVFGPSAWAPGTSAGRRLLAHELAHTIQQRGARKALQPMLQGSRSGESIAEREAEGAADAVMRSERPGIVHRSMPVLRRKKKKKKKGSGAGNAAKGKIINEAAGGCGMCYGPARLGNVGQDVHAQVLGKVRDAMPYIVDNEPLKLAGASKWDIPDLFEYVAESIGARTKVSKVGELKPDSNHGRAQGVVQMARYRRNIPKLPLFANTTIKPLKVKLPDSLDFTDNTSPIGCPKQKIRIRHWQDGIYLYRCIPPWKELVRNKSCKCAGDKDDEEKKKKKKKDKKKDNKKPKNTKTKNTKQKKPATKKPKVKKLPKLKKPGAKVFSLSLGIGINSSSAGAANVGVGISVNSSGTSVGTVGASVTYDSDGNAIGAVGATATKGSQSNIAGGAGVTASEDSSATGAGVASVGTAKKSDVMGAGVASKGSGENVTGTAVGKSGSGDIKDVDIDKAKSGSGGKEGGGDKQGGKPGQAGGEKGEGEEGGEAAEGDVRNTTEFKNAQAEAKRIEEMLAKASPAQKKLIAELVKRHPEHLLPVPNEAFTRKWLNATSGIKDKDVKVLADEGWQPGTDIDEAEFKRRVDLVISGKAPKGEVWTSPEPPPPKKSEPKKTEPKKAEPKKGEPKKETKAEATKDADARFRGVSGGQEKEKGEKPEDLKTQLQNAVVNYDWSSVRVGEVRYDPKVTGVQTKIMYFKSRVGNAAAQISFRVIKKGKGSAIKVLESSDAVTADGTTFPLDLAGEEISFTD